jgi:hypothetical protein
MEDDLQAEIERLTKTVEQCYLVQKRLTEQRDAAFEEVARIQKEVQMLQSEQAKYWGNKCNSDGVNVEKYETLVVLERVKAERDKALVEIERLKVDLKKLDQELKWHNDLRPDWVKKEPSRLEIAMRFAESAWQNRQISEMHTSDQMRWALARADALIAAAKEGK